MISTVMFLDVWNLVDLVIFDINIIFLVKRTPKIHYKNAFRNFQRLTKFGNFKPFFDLIVNESGTLFESYRFLGILMVFRVEKFVLTFLMVWKFAVFTKLAFFLYEIFAANMLFGFYSHFWKGWLQIFHFALIYDFIYHFLGF